MEYVSGGELFHYIDEQGRLDEKEVVWLLRQLVAALVYCHRINIHHRDLKPENILLDQEALILKIVDFGMAALQPKNRLLSTPCGSPYYASPEVLQGRPYDGGQADVWSVGVILFVMLTGYPPFSLPADENNIRKLYKTIINVEYKIPDELSREAKDLIKRILVRDPKKRISITAIWNHPFLHKYDEQLNFTAEDNRLENWIGSRPEVKDWNIRKKDDIDREIMRNMRVLWHSEEEKSIVQKLLCKE